MLLYILLFGGLLAIYFLANLFTITLLTVEAGPISGLRHTGFKRLSKPIASSYRKVYNGKNYLYRRFIVQGCCMTPKQIKENDVINVRIFNDKEEKNSIASDQIVLIFLNDDNFRGYKIRCVDSINGNSAKTFYYDKQGNRVNSSKPHTLESIKGVVEPN